MSTNSNCFFCNTKCEVFPALLSHDIKDYRCSYCGAYILDDKLKLYVPNITKSSIKFSIACILNERRLKGLCGIALSNKTDKKDKIYTYPQVSIDDILDEFPKKASEFLNRTLLNLSRLAKPAQPFGLIRLALTTNGDCLHFFIQDKQECYTFLHELAGQNYIRFNKNKEGREQWDVFSLTTKCWERVENLQQTAIESKRAFVAMWFDKSMDDFYKGGIKKAIKDAGYEPVRIDSQDFNNKICDEIIAEIKRCKFLISDFTGQRGGVYFEAGFAKGLGREVIFTVKEDDVERLHFDTRQYNHIVYDSPEDLYKKLYNRICATIV